MAARGALRRAAAVGLTGLLALPFGLAGPHAGADRSTATSRRQLVTLAGDLATLALDDRYALSPPLTALLGSARLGVADLARRSATAAAAQPTRAVGTQRLWPAIDASQPWLTGL
jgi:hypothetical protein